MPTPPPFQKVANSEVAKPEQPEEDRPKRTGWWNRNGFL